MVNPLLIAKLHLPLPPLARQLPLVPRERLLEKLNRGLSSKVILISAAAGFGKTTALSVWARQLKLPVSWLSLDKRDNDLMYFWMYFVAALQQSLPTIGEATLAMLRSGEPTSAEVFLTPLLNELARARTDCVLVLDDYHSIANPAIHAALSFLLEHLPTQVHLAIATRIDPPLPLSKLRVRGESAEIRANDLRFTDAEAKTFLERSLSQSLTNAQVMGLQKQTEGWIAGLQLAMLSLRDAANPAAFIETFGGEQRYILDYLVEEVLDYQPPLVRSFLLRSSLLEQLCGSLCEAIVEEESVNGAEILEQLERQNLFVVPLDEHRTWYRYHHLFAEALRHILQQTDANRIALYHDRAAQWYEQAGYITDAIHHAIAANSFDDVARLIEQEAQASEYPRFNAIELQNALTQLPPELIQTRPWLLVAKAWVSFTSSQFAEAILAIESLEQLLAHNSIATEDADRLWGLITALKGMHARSQGNSLASVAFLEKALQFLQNNTWLRSLVLLNLGVSYFVADNYEAAKQLLPAVSRIGRVRGTADPAIAGLYLQAQFLTLRGQIERATWLCQQGLDLATDRGWLATYAGVLVQVALADLLREQNQLEAAARHLTQSIDRAIENRQPGLMMGYITLARVRQAQGDLQAAETAIEAAERSQPWLWPTILSVEACQSRLHLAGNIKAAIAWVERRGFSIEDELHYSAAEPCLGISELDGLTYARVLLAQGGAHLADAFQLLARLHDSAQTGGRTIRVMETLLLQALVSQAQGKSEQALSYLDRAMQIVRHGNYVRLFLDEGKPMAALLQMAVSNNLHFEEVKRLLTLFGEEKPTSLQSLVEPLSDRELEVLHYLATGMPNQAIANQLFVSLAAIKWHARNIYGKLEVNNRTQAVARARELRILS